MSNLLVGLSLASLALGGCGNQGTLTGGARADVCAAKIGSQESAVVQGTTTAEFPAVGLMQTDSGALCTGALIHPRVVLLAAHCIDGESGFRFAFGASEASITRSVPVIQTVMHPQYVSSGFDYDLGYLVLSEEVTDVPPIQVDLNRQTVGTPFTIVGYGQTDSSGVGAGVKRTAMATISAVEESGIPTMWAFRYTPSGVCSGDSGGPALQQRGGQLFTIGVANLADPACSEEGNYARFDVQADFVMQALAAGLSAPPPTQPQPMVPDTPGCSNTCQHANDGECDDGGPGAAYGDCAFGTDCMDCGARDASATDPGMTPGPSTTPDPGAYPGTTPTPGTTPGVTCTNECPFAYDGQCDDAGPGSLCSLCPYGSDCADCGAR